MASIQGPAAASQTGPPPTFRVDPSPNAFYAYELATEPELFDQSQHDTARRPENFYASWQDGGLTAASTVRVPDEVWNRLQAANRLYYRVWTSASREQWHNAQTTTPDAQATNAPFIQLVRLLLGGVLNETQTPVAEIWSIAVEQDALRSVTAAGESQAVICWHMFSPKRPVDPRTGEWVVVATTLPDRPGEPIQTGLVRLAVQPLKVKAVQSWQGSSAPVERDDVMERLSANEWRLDVGQLRRVGEFWVASELRPPPGAGGGTAIVHAQTGQVLYQATTG